MYDKPKTVEEPLTQLFEVIEKRKVAASNQRRQQEDRRLSRLERRRPLWWRE